ncbi:MAG: hypothetical protein HC834_02775 [Rhodospirillales bacterium]|nr:hypothetical protein [Rhodospirillales bacterium]
MNGAYKKECWLAIVAFAVVTLFTHIFPMYYLFPGLTNAMLFGYPAAYILTIIIGWLGLIPLYWIYINMSENIDDEIRSSKPSEGSSIAQALSTTSAPGGNK